MQEIQAMIERFETTRQIDKEQLQKAINALGGELKIEGHLMDNTPYYLSYLLMLSIRKLNECKENKND